MGKKDEATEVAPNLMFSQRNNPYCDLLKISAAKLRFFYKSTKYFAENLYLWGKIIKKEQL